MNPFSRALHGQAILPRLSLILVTLCFCGGATAQIKAAFLAPDPAGTSAFWTQTIEVMQAVAEDLQIELQVVYSKTNTYSNRKDGVDLLNNGDKPDFFLTGYWTGATEYLLDHAEQRSVHSFIFNAGVVAEDRNKVGRPRERYSRWLGQMTPDDRQAGYDLAEVLMSAAENANPDGAGPVHVIGIGGYGDISTDTRRRAGLEQRVDEAPDAVLDRFVFAQWSQTTAYNALLEVLQPDTPVSLVWSAGDSMALGAVEALRKLGKTPGRDVYAGGMDWSRRGIESVAAGDLEVTLGGHFMEGAWALILLHDYYHGHDFAGDLGVEFHTHLTTVTSDNAGAYLDKLYDADWQSIDFKQFSKVHNPDLKTYEWPLVQILEQLAVD